MSPWKCPDCGTWWSGLEHRCPPTGTDTGANARFTIRVWPEPSGTGGTTMAPWCSICQGWHIPGHGPCTATWCLK